MTMTREEAKIRAKLAKQHLDKIIDRNGDYRDLEPNIIVLLASLTALIIELTEQRFLFKTPGPGN